MAAHAQSTRLRLVGDRRTRDDLVNQQVADEMRAAASMRSLDPTDPRLVLATRTQQLLQGPALSPDRRRELLDFAHDLGMRPFDANLVIAIVQDQARQDGAQAAPPTPITHRLQIVGAPTTHPAPERTARHAGLALVTSVLGAIGVTTWLVFWLLGG